MIFNCNFRLYPDFKLRYQVLGSAELASSDDNKTAVYALCDKIGFGRERYRLGHTIVFFRAGALAFLEEMRDDKLAALVTMTQALCRAYLMRTEFVKMTARRHVENSKF